MCWVASIAGCGAKNFYSFKLFLWLFFDQNVLHIFLSQKEKKDLSGQPVMNHQQRPSGDRTSHMNI